MGRSASIIYLSIKPTVPLENTPLFNDIARKLAMHIVAAKPLYLSSKDVPSSFIEKETAIFR